MIAIVDYGVGNLFSLRSSLRALGADSLVSGDREELMRADKLILPGVGAFGDAADKLRAAGLDGLLRDRARAGVPLLGVCLGMQLLFDESQESPGVKGLGILKGKIVRFPEDKGLKIPQIGWNDLSFPNEGRLFKGLDEHPYVYFVHSYYLEAEDPSIVTATTEYGVTVHASVEHGNVFACQFHPEKSSQAGLSILRNFLEL